MIEDIKLVPLKSNCIQLYIMIRTHLGLTESPAKLLRKYRKYYSKKFIFRIVFNHELSSLLDELNLREYVTLPIWYPYKEHDFYKGVDWETNMDWGTRKNKCREAVILIGEYHSKKPL